MIRLKNAFSRPRLFGLAAPAAFSLLGMILMLCTGSASAHALRQQHIQSPSASWIGKKFVFLPADGYRQSYDTFTVTKTYGVSAKHFGDEDGLSYAKFVGKVITCVKVQTESVIFDVPEYHIQVTSSLVSDTDGQRDAELLTTIDTLAPVTEIETVKQAYLGKTVWVNYSNRGADRNLPWPYDPIRKNIIQKFSHNQLVMADLPRGTPLIVMDVRWGSETLRPVRLVVRDSAGHYFCYEVAADPTNKGLKTGTPLDTADRSLSKTKPSVSL